MKKNLFNILSLAATQGFNALLPLVIFPYLLNVMGSEKYSSIVVAESISLIILTSVLYSYEVNGLTRVVRARKHGAEELSSVFSEIFFSRLFIWITCVVVATACCLLFSPEMVLVLNCWSLVSLGYIFQASFLFQGLENNGPVAFFTMISRVACVCCILYFANSGWPVYYPPLLIGGSFLGTGVCSFLYARIRLKIRLKSVSFSTIFKSLLDGRSIFSGNFSVVLFRDSNILILKFFGVDASLISSYSIAEKFIKSLQATMRPLNQFYYAKIVHDFVEGWKPNRDTLRFILSRTWLQVSFVTVVLVSGAVVWFFIGDYVALQITDKYNLHKIVLLACVMVPATLLGIGNFMLGTTGLNNLNSSGYYARVLFINGLITLASGSLLIYLFKDVGAAITFVLGECVLLVLVLYKYLFEQESRVV
ncbi:oligosaccharide flippase family protein [Bdellovibrio bacteriovorus]|uniref:oligosaccharide flippase family protein n=1 Tax=Bdellovibrio bacteriovorus TaxID=959 RepID=UPI003A807FB9